MSKEQFPFMINPQNVTIIPVQIISDIPPPIQNISSNENSKNFEKPTLELEAPKVIEDFEWINYLTERKEINYIQDFLNKKSSMALNYKAIDLQELEDVAIINVPKEFQSVAQDQYKRLLRFGGLDSKDNIAMKSGAIEKEHYNDKFNDFYDTNDPWINDDEEEAHENNKEVKETKKMAIPEVYYKDFFANKGNLYEFCKSNGYNERIKLLDNFDNIYEKNEKEHNTNDKKRKLPEKECKVQDINGDKPKLPIKKKGKKKVKTNADIEYINPYNIPNPFLFAEPNNFVVGNLLINSGEDNFLAPNLINKMNNVPNSALIRGDQIFDKIKNVHSPSFNNMIDMNNLGNIGVDLFNILFNNNGKIQAGFPIGANLGNIDFNIDPIALSNLNINMGMELNKKVANKEINNKKKGKNLDFKSKREQNLSTFNNNDSNNLVIEINEDSSPEMEKK